LIGNRFIFKRDVGVVHLPHKIKEVERKKRIHPKGWYRFCEEIAGERKGESEPGKKGARIALRFLNSSLYFKKETERGGNHRIGVQGKTGGGGRTSRRFE